MVFSRVSLFWCRSFFTAALALGLGACLGLSFRNLGLRQNFLAVFFAAAGARLILGVTVHFCCYFGAGTGVLLRELGVCRCPQAQQAVEGGDPSSPFVSVFLQILLGFFGQLRLSSAFLPSPY